MAPFESLGTVSYSHSILDVSLAVLTQYTNVTDKHRTTSGNHRRLAGSYRPVWYPVTEVGILVNEH